MRTQFTRPVTAALGAFLAVGLAVGCSWTESEPDATSVVPSALPDDTDKSQSKRNAERFRSWVDAHGTKSQRAAAARVERVIREGDGGSGKTYIATDINGGPTPVEDGMATADDLAAAFGKWKASEEGVVSVYDVNGNVLVAKRA
ncbi:hypothetical protein [Streptomyces sp. NPDC017940]|uniref:hypothetical protein n=1 Tax=Streptomyces sp. NPDC017940 TaxID=3365017 RepID=UPI0037A54D07